MIFNSCGSSSKKIDELQNRITTMDRRVKELETQNTDLKNQNASLNERFNPVDFTFWDYEYKNKHRVIEKEVKTRQLPDEEITEQYTLFPHCVVLVEDAAKDENNVLWLFVSWQEEIYTLKGWIKEGDTAAITKDNIKTAGGAITIKKGALIYRLREFDEIPATKPESLKEDLTSGTFIREKDNYYYISFPGGLEVIADKKYVDFKVFE